MTDSSSTGARAPASIRSYLESNDAALMDLTEALVTIDSQNPPGETAEAVELLESRFDAIGIESERVAIDPTKPNLVGEIPGQSDRTFLFDGHLDTVPFDSEHWEFDPYGERDGERLYGRGTTDMKGAVAAMAVTLEAFATTETVPPVTLKFAFVSDEESAGPAGTRALLEQDRLEADACVIGEPTCEGGLHSVTIADKGSIWLTLEASGTAAHGSRPPLGDNAIDRLLTTIKTIEKYLETIEFDLDASMVQIVDESVSFYQDRLGEADARRLFTKPTANLGVIDGGQSINRVPDRAMAKLDIRVTAGVHTPTLLDAIREIIEDRPQVQITEASWSLGTYEPIEAPIVTATTESAAAVAGERIYRRSATGGGDAKLLREAGISTVEFAFATETSHAVDEFTTATILTRNGAVYSRLPYAFADAAVDDE